jgi:hypothetical protein
MDKLRQQRTLTNLLLAISALVLGIIAQNYFWFLEEAVPASTPTDGLLAYGVVVVLFAMAVLSTPFRAGLPSGADPDDPSFEVRHSTWFVIFLCLAGAALVVSLTLFGHGILSSLSWFAYLGAIVAFLGAAYSLLPPGTGNGWRPRWPSRKAVRSSRLWFEGLALLLILAVGAFFRLYRFTELPYGLWYDEADNGLATRQILSNPDFRPVYVPSTNLPAHFLYLVALSFRLFGD